MNIGDIAVDPVFDGTVRFEPSDALLGIPSEVWAGHQDFLDSDGALEAPVGGYLVRTSDRVVLVDLGTGPIDLQGDGWSLRGGAMLDSLASLGLAPADVSDVLFTHLHLDHVGWASRDGVPVFPNAAYRCHADDWSHFFGSDEPPAALLDGIQDRVELWARDGTILPGIDILAAPGHTPGSTILVLSSGDDRAVLLGDVVHCPAQLVEDEWEAVLDVDPVRAKQTRQSVVRELEQSGDLVGGAHFDGMRFGRLLRTEEGRREWVVAPG